MSSHRAALPVVALSFLLLAGCRTASQSPPVTPSSNADARHAGVTAVATQWRDDIAAISAGADGQGRRAAIEARLQALGLTVERQAFVHESTEGTNLLVDLGGPAGAPLLLIGAHSDRVDAGVGATDNASGSAVVLALAEALKTRPLAHHRVALAFWDLEEKGLRGARAYVARKSPRPALYVNVDIFGWGDTLWMMTPDAAHPLAAATKSAAGSAGLHVVAGDQYPPTDHLAFLEAKWPAVSYSLVGQEEIPLILEVFAKRKPATMPKVMRVIHSPGDVVAETKPQEAARGIAVLESALRAWDATATPAAP